MKRRTQPRSPMWPAKVRQGIRGPVTSKHDRSVDVTDDPALPDDRPVHVQLGDREVLAEDSVAQLPAPPAGPPVQLLARHGIHRLESPPWWRWSPMASPTTPLPSPPFLGPGARTSIRSAGCLSMAVPAGAEVCRLGVSCPTLTLRMQTLGANGMP